MSSKRPRIEAPLSSAETPQTPPLYGSKEYWEERYQKQSEVVEQANEVLDEESTDEKSPAEDTGTSTESTLPFHSWYYTYGELRPLLLPLVLGRLDESHNFLLDEASEDALVQNDLTVGKDDTDDADDAGNKSTVPLNEPALYDEVKEKQSKVIIQTADDKNSTQDPDDDDDDECSVEDANNGDEQDDIEEVEDNDGEVENTLERDGLASNGPITILEIGCGDVPLGAGLALDLKALEDTKGVASSTVVTSITCTDYSQVVVDMMQKQHQVKPSTVATKSTNENKCQGSVVAQTIGLESNPLEFVVADARHLPYADNSYTLVLEKGTLDAMLSDTDQGVADCIQIVAECARVASACIVLISHLNALTIEGQRWLEEVVMGGLSRHSEGNDDDDDDDCSPNTVAWEIEVHGNEDSDDEDDEEEDSKDGNDKSGSSGPAVYIIHKKQLKPVEATAANEGDTTQAVSVKYFSY